LLKRISQWVAVAVALGLSTGSALANEGITASPTTQSVELTAGSSYSGSVKVFDSGTTDYKLTLNVDPYSVHGEDYDQSFVLQRDMIDASRWFHLDQTSYDLKAGQHVAVSYQITVPPGVGPGGYYAVLFAENKTPTGEGSIKSLKRVGIIFYLSVKGPLNVSGNVESFAVPWLHLAPPLHATLRMKNDGNVHFDTDIDIQVKDLFGNTKSMLSAQKIILPSTIRRIPLDWEDAPGFGLFRVEGTVKFNGTTEPLPARYTLMLSSGAFVVMFLLALALATYAFLTRKRRGNVARRR
jgi:hypothetical protein